jgi:diguanylate cyclase (GGDEF)-like protein
MGEIDFEGAVACRVGGEEFSIILPNADRTRAGQAAEDLRQSVAEMRAKYMGGTLPKVTVSTGIAIYPTHGTQAKDLMKQADLALYAAKKAGRNRWKIAEGDGMLSFE